MNGAIRNKALKVLRNATSHSELDVYKAIVDLRRHGKSGDERLLVEFLEFPDEMVVAATLYSFLHVYKPPRDLLDRLIQFAGGDSRDTGEMPIQSQAIEGILMYAREESEALCTLIQVADNDSTAEAPRARAWQCLAESFGVPWDKEYIEVMILDPESEQSQTIREMVSNAIHARNGVPMGAPIPRR